MVDRVNTVVLADTAQRYIATFNNVSDGTGETDATKVAIDTLVTGLGVAPRTLVVEKIEWAMQGYTRIELYWDTPEQNLIAVLTTDMGEMDFVEDDKMQGLIDPDADADSTRVGGNIVLTSAGANSGDSYTITMWLRKKQ